jgi:hypothetical protein
MAAGRRSVNRGPSRPAAALVISGAVNLSQAAQYSSARPRGQQHERRFHGVRRRQRASVEVKIVAAVTAFPTVTQGGGALIVDLATLQDVLAAQSLPPTQATAR